MHHTQTAEGSRGPGFQHWLGRGIDKIISKAMTQLHLAPEKPLINTEPPEKKRRRAAQETKKTVPEKRPTTPSGESAYDFADDSTVAPLNSSRPEACKQSSFREESTTSCVEEENGSGNRPIIEKIDIKSEEEIIEELLGRVPGFSGRGKVSLLNALFHEPNPQPPTNFKYSVFQHLHALFDSCHHHQAARTFQQERNDARDRLKAADDSLRQTKRVLEHEKQVAEAAKARSEKERCELQSKIDQLSNLHVRSVNGISTGVDPISDKTFSKTLSAHHSATARWCRRNAGSTKLGDIFSGISPELQEFFRTHCHKDAIRVLTLSQAVDKVLWINLHAHTIGSWLPVEVPLGMSEFTEQATQAFLWQNDTPEHSQRVQFWHEYTACLAFQSPSFPPNLDEAVNTFMLGFVPVVNQLLKPDATEKISALREIVRAIHITAAELKCQRGFYEIEQVVVGTEFNPDVMDNADKSGEIDEKGTARFVRMVLSEGIVKRPYRGSPEETGRIWKSEVFVGEAELNSEGTVSGQANGVVIEQEDVVMRD